MNTQLFKIKEEFSMGDEVPPPLLAELFVNTQLVKVKEEDEPE